MEEHIDFAAIAPEGLKAMRGLETYIRNSGLEHSLLELVKTRVSQINGCAYCIDMHTKDARAKGEMEQRLYALSSWHETPFFSARERAALKWAEALTRLSGNTFPEGLREETLRNFSLKEMVDLTLAIITINGWNKLAIPSRMPVGNYQPG